KEIHRIGVERRITARAQSGDHFLVPTFGGVRLFQLLHVDPDAGHDNDHGDDEYNDCVGHHDQRPEKSGLRFSRNARMPSTPSTVAACRAMVSLSRVMWDSRAPSECATSRFVWP